MNPLTNVRNIEKLSQLELQGKAGGTSWHDEYRSSAWVFIGGLPYELTEGDVISIFSQFGEPVNLNLVRDVGTGKSKGFAFLCYEDQRSTVLAVDNFNGIKICGRTIRVDHVKDYKPPKESDKLDDVTREIRRTGCGPGVQLPGVQPLPQSASRDDDDDVYLLPYDKPDPPLLAIKDKDDREKRHKKKSKKHKTSSSKKVKKDKKSKKSKKSSSSSSKKRKRNSSSSSEDSDSDSSSESGSSEEDRSRAKKSKRRH